MPELFGWKKNRFVYIYEVQNLQQTSAGKPTYLTKFAKSAGTGNQDKHSYSVMKLLHLLITELLNIYTDEKIEYRSKRGWEYDGVRGGGGGMLKYSNFPHDYTLRF